MSHDVRTAIRPTQTDRADSCDSFGPNWGERIVMAVATSLAVLIVATIAVLMGMA